jgi:hypothetical protein
LSKIMWASMRGEFATSPSYKTASYSRRTNIYKDTCRKFKIPDYQNGHVYLTSHRICYVDNADPRKNSIAIDLKDVDRYEFYVSLPTVLRWCI